MNDINALYVFTAISDGKEQIAIGADGVPFIYLSKDIIDKEDMINKFQEWANNSGQVFKLRLFAHLSTLDEIVPMKTNLTM